MKKVWVALYLSLSFAATIASATAQPLACSAARQVLAAEKARTTALDHSDIAALQHIMADDVTYVHASGKVDTKASYLTAIRSGQLHYISWQPKDLHVRILGGGDTAVLTGEYRVRVTDSRVQKAPFDVSLIVLSVYERRHGTWQQVAWQSTRTPAAPK
jgi:ketosteroid isomerase-like protein